MKKHYHLIGIGGVGMGPLGLLLLGKGHSVSGSDLRENGMTRQLQEAGACVKNGHRAEYINGAEWVVFSSAIPATNPEKMAAKEKGIPLIPRAKLLAELMEDHVGITVAGAHGKTTTTSMIARLLSDAELEPTVAIGGTFQGSSLTAQVGGGRYFVAEVDESDGSFLYFQPQYSVITNIDFEHGDYYRNWTNLLDAHRQFILKTKPDGKILICGHDARLLSLAKESGRSFQTFGFDVQFDAAAQNVELRDWSTSFDGLIQGKPIGHFELNVPGRHNVLNALAAILVGVNLGIDVARMRESLKNFRGVRRRLELISQEDDIWIVDDYAHHPTEIQAVLEAVQRFSRKRKITVFQPHRYSRLQLLLPEFARVLAKSEELIVTDLYAASETPIEGVNAESLTFVIQKLTSNPVRYLAKEQLVDYLRKIAQPGDLILTLGAGDITQVAWQLADCLKKIEAKV